MTSDLYRLMGIVPFVEFYNSSDVEDEINDAAARRELELAQAALAEVEDPEGIWQEALQYSRDYIEGAEATMAMHRIGRREGGREAEIDAAQAMDKLIAEPQSVKAEHNSCKDTESRLCNRLSDLDKKYKATAADLQQRCDEYRAEAARLQRQCDAERATSARLQQQYDEEKAKSARLQQQYDTSKNVVEQLRQQSRHHEGDIKELQKQYEAHQVCTAIIEKLQRGVVQDQHSTGTSTEADQVKAENMLLKKTLQQVDRDVESLCLTAKEVMKSFERPDDVKALYTRMGRIMSNWRHGNIKHTDDPNPAAALDSFVREALVSYDIMRKQYENAIQRLKADTEASKQGHEVIESLMTDRDKWKKACLDTWEKAVTEDQHAKAREADLHEKIRLRDAVIARVRVLLALYGVYV